MATGADYNARAAQLLGIPYEASGRRFGPDVMDCSGFMSRLYREVVGTWPDDGGARTSWSLALWSCAVFGGGISVDEARNHPGESWLLMGPTSHCPGDRGYGSDGHIADVKSADETYETPAWGRWGHASGIGRISGRNWAGAVRIPAIFGGAATPVEPAVPELNRALLEGGGSRMVTFMIRGRVFAIMPASDGSLVLYLFANGMQLYPQVNLAGPGTVDVDYPGGEWHSIPDGYGGIATFRSSDKNQVVSVKFNAQGDAAGVWVNTQPINIARF